MLYYLPVCDFVLNVSEKLCFNLSQVFICAFFVSMQHPKHLILILNQINLTGIQDRKKCQDLGLDPQPVLKYIFKAKGTFVKVMTP